MNRLRRIIKVGLVTVSLLFCFAVAALWTYSMFRHGSFARGRTESIEDEWARSIWELRWGNGVLAVIHVTTDGYPRGANNTSRISSPGWAFIDMQATAPGFAEFFAGISDIGFSSGKQLARGDLTIRAQFVRFPLWLPLLLASLPADIALYRLLHARRARRRAARNHCPTCNYDLRESPGRCPECGREATAK